MLVIVVSAFYWFELRPEQIREECDKYAIEMVNYDMKVNANVPKSYGALTFDSGKQGDSYYHKCLREKGMINQ